MLLWLPHRLLVICWRMHHRRMHWCRLLLQLWLPPCRYILPRASGHLVADEVARVASCHAHARRKHRLLYQLLLPLLLDHRFAKRVCTHGHGATQCTACICLHALLLHLRGGG